MACQTKIAKTIIEQKGDYLLAVKGNQGNLSKKRSSRPSAPLRNDASSLEALQTEKQHGRIESRLCQVLDASTLEGNFSRWKGLKTLAMITSFPDREG